LESFDEDQSIKGIIVFTHVPPYTNSPLHGVSGGDEKVREDFLLLFCSNKMKKTIAFISAHAHGYERFENT
jgi:hypothetical protein